MACPAALLYKQRMGGEVGLWAQPVVGQEPSVTDSGFLVFLPRLPAPLAMEAAVLGLPVWEGWRVAGVHLLSKMNPCVVVIIIIRAVLSSFCVLPQPLDGI